MSSARTSPTRDMSGAAQKAAHTSALNWGRVCVSVMAQACVAVRCSSITRQVMATVIPPTCHRLGIGSAHGTQDREHHHRHLDFSTADREAEVKRLVDL